MNKTHQKRSAMPTSWPVPRKGTTFVVKSNNGKGVPILVALRDMLKVAKTRKEVKIALNMENVLINQRKVLNDKNAVCLFDVVTLVPSKSNFRMGLSNKGKFQLFEIKENEAQEKAMKVISKTILKGKKIQLNLGDGFNITSDVKCNVNDSVIVNVQEKKILSSLELKEKANVLIIAGKHAGFFGQITSIDTDKKMIELDSKGKTINALIKQIIIIK